MNYIGIIKETGQMDWKRLVTVKINADSMEQANEKFARFVDKKNRLTQYRYELVKIKEVQTR